VLLAALLGSGIYIIYGIVRHAAHGSLGYGIRDMGYGIHGVWLMAHGSLGTSFFPSFFFPSAPLGIIYHISIAFVSRVTCHVSLRVSCARVHAHRPVHWPPVHVHAQRTPSTTPPPLHAHHAVMPSRRIGSQRTIPLSRPPCTRTGTLVVRTHWYIGSMDACTALQFNVTAGAGVGPCAQAPPPAAADA
jgi:hypothetical protein